MSNDSEGGGVSPARRAVGDALQGMGVREVLRVGTWNMLGWRAAKARVLFPEVGADVLAVQETHLAAMLLQWAHSAVRETWDVYTMGGQCQRHQVGRLGDHVV